MPARQYVVRDQGDAIWRQYLLADREEFFPNILWNPGINAVRQDLVELSPGGIDIQ